jgi:hypothetical protein
MARPEVTGKKFFRRAEAALYVTERWGIPRSPRTLAKLACIGGGPPFRRAGRFPLYEPPDLDDWAQSKISAPVRTTSEYLQAEREAV